MIGKFLSSILRNSAPMFVVKAAQYGGVNQMAFFCLFLCVFSVVFQVDTLGGVCARCLLVPFRKGICGRRRLFCRIICCLVCR